ncbi:S1C family serine protease [Haloarcula salinisoli]|uniref:Trypsin-like peptidase domain-containing protein n=1 Tax=Haloarcula salinisoli TaxID=2487746 RepID=A0A8J8C7E1_9EURY|nr:trypsin-like peptidase domain-containing protein [Halomicroarcula salinisoli]MBX0285271.1 trypsin-like peptidase domain-containing protein [Halomicroarcula salinisoli]MBX0303251.1 trypsin-like peptidase domain-containing protein [Halomicroarcula salinisoli]
MDSDGLSRRRLLAAVGVGVAGTAGCQSLVTSSDQSSEGSPEPTPTSASGRAASGEDSVYTDVYDEVADGVVSIQVYDGATRPSSGSGFLIDGGYIVTNEHVVSAGDTVYVRYAGTDWREVTVAGTDVYSDLAVIDVDTAPDTTDPLSWVNSRPAIGTRVVAIGNPFGLSGSVSEGIVSGVDRTLRGANNFSIAAGIQTDAAVNPGNSGGPLVDLDGNVVGVINSGGGDNVGFAISAQLAQRVIPALIEDGSYAHPYMGVGLSNVSPIIAEANDLEQASGIYINSVRSAGPSDGVLEGSTGTARVNGVEVGTGGDVVRRLDDTPTPTRQDLAAYLALETSPGDTLSVTVQRDGDRQTVEITLGTRPAPR